MVEPKTKETKSHSSSLSSSFQRASEKERQNALLKFQAEKYQEWRKSELRFIGKFLMIHNFIEHPLDRWYHASFTVQGDYDISCEISSDWKQFPEKKISTKGLNLSGKILQPKCSVYLRSLACDTKVKVKLYGDSSIFFISRNPGDILPSSPVIRVTRDTSLKGVYVMFGEIEQSTKKYTYYKQVQIPEDYSLQPIGKNYKDLEITFSDNGDDRVFLSVCSLGKYSPIKQFVTFCDFFLPFFEKSRVLVGGCGDPVMLKFFSVQQRERNYKKLLSRPQDCCCRVI